MNKILPFLFVFILACHSKKTTEPEFKKGNVPSIELYDLTDNPIKLDSEIIILNLWATWCKPCIAEMPDLEEMQKQLPENFRLILASEEPLERQLNFINRQSFELDFVQLKSGMESLGVYALPTTLILDSEGNILETMVGTRAWNTPEQILQITSYLK